MDDTGLGIFQLLVELAGIHQLSELLTNYHDLAQNVKNALSVVGVFTVIFGILQCFLGYKLFKFWCGLIGLLFGGMLGLFIAASGVFSGSAIAGVIGLLVVVLLAIIGAYAAFRLYLAGLFIYAFFAAFLVGFFLFAIITDSTILGLYAGFIAGVVFGVIAVIHHRFWIIVTTSVSGGMTVGSSLVMVLQSTDSPWVYIMPVLFIIAGFIVQTQTVKKGASKASKDGASITNPLVYAPAPPPPAYPPYPGTEPPVSPQDGTTQYDPDAPTVPIPHSTDAAGTTSVVYSCPNCDYTAINNTAPCRNCGGAVQIRNGQ